MRIYSKTVTELWYVNSKGDEKPLREINDEHLLNAYAAAIRDEGSQSYVAELHGEILCRINA